MTLQQRDAEKDLGPGHAQHLPGFGLALGHSLDAAAVDLRKIAGVVDGKGHHGRHQTAAAARRPRAGKAHQAGAKIDDKDLQHQRRAANDPDKGLNCAAQRGKPAHGAERHYQPQRQCEQ